MITSYFLFAFLKRLWQIIPMRFFTKDLLNEVIGWYGAFAILLGFTLLNFEILNSKSYWYLTLNLTGAFSLSYISWVKKAYPPTVLNFIYGVIAAISIVRQLLS